MSRPEKSKYMTWKILLRLLQDWYYTKVEEQASQSSMIEVKKSIYAEALFKQLHFILGIWSPLKAFTDLYCLF